MIQMEDIRGRRESLLHVPTKGVTTSRIDKYQEVPSGSLNLTTAIDGHENQCWGSLLQNDHQFIWWRRPNGWTSWVHHLFVWGKGRSWFSSGSTTWQSDPLVSTSQMIVFYSEVTWTPITFLFRKRLYMFHRRRGLWNITGGLSIWFGWSRGQQCWEEQWRNPRPSPRSVDAGRTWSSAAGTGSPPRQQPEVHIQL